jgi:Isochorismate synthase
MEETESSTQLILKETELLKTLLDYTRNNAFAVAAWSLPNDDSITVIVSEKPEYIARETALEDLPPGYLFAPYNRRKDSLFLQADYTFRLSNGQLVTPSNEAESKSVEWLSGVIQRNATTRNSSPAPRPERIEDYSREHYVNMVHAALAEVEAGTFEKVVPSRRKLVQLPGEFDPISAFLKLCKAYSHAFVSITSSPQTGTWLGASPEELVRVFDRTIFKTVALAGTQPYIEGQNLRDVSWTQKEIEEQALVERYIISCFKKIRLREYDEFGPKTVIAGNLMHLRSEFTVNMKETNFPQLGTVMLQLLHPTSAVCGMPLEPAQAFIEKHEGYDRGFYSGFLGPVNIDNQINLFVNLRCTEVFEGSAVLYAGAGVTIDSVPEKEWEETEMKMNTMLSLIQ